MVRFLTSQILSCFGQLWELELSWWKMIPRRLLVFHISFVSGKQRVVCSIRNWARSFHSGTNNSSLNILFWVWFISRIRRYCRWLLMYYDFIITVFSHQLTLLCVVASILHNYIIIASMLSFFCIGYTKNSYQYIANLIYFTSLMP